MILGRKRFQILWAGYFFLFVGLPGDDSETVHAFQGAVEGLGLRAIVDEEEERTGVLIFLAFFFILFSAFVPPLFPTMDNARRHTHTQRGGVQARAV